MKIHNMSVCMSGGGLRVIPCLVWPSSYRLNLDKLSMCIIISKKKNPKNSNISLGFLFKNYTLVKGKISMIRSILKMDYNIS